MLKDSFLYFFCENNMFELSFTGISMPLNQRADSASLHPIIMPSMVVFRKSNHV